MHKDNRANRISEKLWKKVETLIVHPTHSVSFPSSSSSPPPSQCILVHKANIFIYLFTCLFVNNYYLYKEISIAVVVLLFFSQFFEECFGRHR